MDKNFFIAIAGAFLVLTIYQSVFVVPKNVQKAKESQTTAINKDIVNSTISNTVAPETTIKTTNIDFIEEKTKIETTHLKVEFSNVGGSLHNVTYGYEKKPLSLENMLTIKGFEESPFKLVSKTEKGLVYAYSDSDWKILKKFDIENDHQVNLSIEVSKNNNSRLEEIKIGTVNINGTDVQKFKSKSAMLHELSILENNKVIRKGNASKFSGKDNKTVGNGLEWVGYREHFDALIVKPQFETKAYEYQSLNEYRMNVYVTPKEQLEKQGQTASYNFTIIVGNQDIAWLKTYGQKFEKIVAFFNWNVFDIFAKAIYYTVPALHSVCRSWGFSIILVSLLIYGITYPLTIKSMASMKKMQLVQPKIQALQKKHKGEPQKLNAEMVDLYKREGVNPLGGCLPFLLQMPIFIALYQALWRSYYFQGKSFLWIKDLAEPDRLFILPFSLPFLENEFNILPILMGIVMFVQQKISSKSMVITDETQAMQQKMMKYFFPVFIAFIFYHFASGLSLYFTVFYALSAWTQWKITKK